MYIAPVWQYKLSIIEATPNRNKIKTNIPAIPVKMPAEKYAIVSQFGLQSRTLL